MGSVKFSFFLQEWSFGLSRSSKVFDFGTNRKGVYDFLLVRHSNIGPILHCFGDIAAFLCSWHHPYSILILGVFPFHQIADVGVNVSRYLELFGREIIIIFEVFQPMWSRYLNVTDRQRRTDGRHTVISALCVSSRGKKVIVDLLLLAVCICIWIWALWDVLLKHFTNYIIYISYLQLYRLLSASFFVRRH